MKKLTALVTDTAGFYGDVGSLRQSFRLAWFKQSKKPAVVVHAQGTDIHLRNNWVDLEVFKATYHERFHRPPFQLPANPVIVDLGSNIGLTLIDFKNLYPEATVVGVEMDAANFAQLQKNIGGLRNCRAVNAAIWKEDGEIVYEDTDPQAYAIVSQAGSKTKTMRAISMPTLLQTFSLDTVDYLKMDIEGAEYELLNEAAEPWLQKVRSVNIEYHPTAALTQAEGFVLLSKRLQKAGFTVFKSSTHWSSLFAVNNHSFANP